VWEVTLSCNLKCRHCGSRAGQPRSEELTTNECLRLIGELAEAGTKEIVLIGGEAYLRPDWLTLVSEISRRRILCGLQTGGRALTEAKIKAAAAAGLNSVGVSIDGGPPTHDALRGVKGSHVQAVTALRTARKHGLMVTANTQINRRNKAELRDVFETIVQAGATGWQVQLTVPMGNAADADDLILNPYELGEIIPQLHQLFREGLERGLQLIPGNNVGYFGPFESAWRSTSGRPEYYGGCQAGRSGLGIEADGTLKGCPSLPTAPYTGGNVRDGLFRDIWASSQRIGFMRDREASKDRRWGFCRKCYYGAVCRGGCTWTTHVVAGRPGNNPFCHYRVLRLAERGLHEVIAQREKPEGKTPFDFGSFDIVVEGEDGAQYGQELFERADFTDIVPGPDAVLDELALCGACSNFFYTGESRCPHCGAHPDAPSSRPELDNELRIARQAAEHLAEIERILARLKVPSLSP
jgi:radical SAM protein with 4Fe4S-binding SPASM domain